jgi:hypothetical protein
MGVAGGDFSCPDASTDAANKARQALAQSAAVRGENSEFMLESIINQFNRRWSMKDLIEKR